MLEMWRVYPCGLSARQCALIGALLVGGISGICLLWGATTETVVTVAQESEPPPREIAGLAAAARRASLRNPFTDAHETFGETSHSMENVTGDAKVSPSHPSAADVPLLTTSLSPSSPAPQPILLRGVVTDADGVRIAILAKGAEGAALSVGETWQGHTLRSLTDRTATLDSASGIITLTRE